MRNGWEKALISQLADVVTGKTPPTSDRSNYGSFLPFVSPADLGEFKYISSSEKYLSKKGSEKARILPIGTCLFTCIGSTIGKVGVSAVELTTNQQINAAIAKNGVCGEYLYYSLCDIAPKIKKLAGVQAIPIINKTEFENQILWIPIELLEQKAIADLLSTWDEAIEKTQRLIQAKEQFKIGQLQKLITNNKANSTIGAFAKPIIRKVTKPSEPYVALGIRSHFKGTFQKNVEDPNSLSMDTLYKVKKDDLILNITFAWEGAIALVKEEDEKCYVSHRFPTYRIIQEKAEASFVRQLILSSRMKYDLSNISPGGAGRNRVLNKKDFLKMPIWIPDLEKQKNIGDLLGTLDQEIDLLKHLADKYKTQKRGLMQKLLTGSWRIKSEILNKYKEG